MAERKPNTMRDVLRWIFRRIARIYFRQIEVKGDVPRGDTGGRLFAANHVNGLVDPILVLTQAPCSVSPVAKSTLWKIPGLRWLLDVANAVPIVRRKDAPNKSAEDNEAVFTRVAAHLASGGNILIFPEGTSHNEPHLLALRSGAGRMLARAAKEREEAVLTFQAVALEFDERDIFRSRALVLFGPVRSVPRASDDIAKAVTDTIREDLSELLVKGTTWEERILLVRAATMFGSSLEEVNRFGRRIEAARRALTAASPELVRSLEGRLRKYFAAIDAEEIEDEVVARGGSYPIDGGRILRAAAMIASLPLAAAAAVLYFLPYQLPRFVTRALKGDPDVASTYKLGVGLVVYPFWMTLAIVLGWMFVPLQAPAKVILALLVVAGPFACLPWLDRVDRLASRLRLLAPSSVRRARLAALVAEREALVADLSAAAEEVDA